MSKPIRVIKSIAVTDAVMSTSVPETDYDAWAIGTTYALAERVIRVSTHKVYESLIAGNVGNTPETSPEQWLEIGATNRWKMLDLSSTSTTTVDASDYYEFTPAQAVSAVALINISGILSVRVRVTDPIWGVVYDKTADLSTFPNESSWYAWFFEPRTEQTSFVCSDLPSYPNATLRFDVTSSGAATIGACVFGSIKEVGDRALQGVRLGIQDYSRKERNAFGDTVLVQRSYAKRVSVNTIIFNENLDNTYDLLTELRATPCLWLIEDRIRSLVVFGFYANFEITIAYANHSDCSLEIEGLV